MTTQPEIVCNEIFERIKQYGVEQFQDAIKTCNKLANDKTPESKSEEC